MARLSISGSLLDLSLSNPDGDIFTLSLPALNDLAASGLTALSGPSLSGATHSGVAPPNEPGIIFIGDANGVSVSGGNSGGGSAQPAPSGVLDSYTSGAPGHYNINIVFKGTWTTTFQDVFKTAANRLSATIDGDVPDVRVRNTVIDDISITAEIKAIDGIGGILGQSGPTAVRSGSYLPATATMQFDSADAASYLSQGLFDEIVTHEMMHSVGFGTIWSYLGLTSGMSFIGSNATAAYNALVDQFTGSPVGTSIASGVPLETGGGSGTAGSHWSEDLFKNELMTGYLNAPTGIAIPDPLSAMSVASLADLGYKLSSHPPTDVYQLT